MIAEQLDLEQALRAREVAMVAVLGNESEAWKRRAEQAIRDLAATGEPFISDDVRARAGDPPHHANAMGALISTARTAGIIEMVGFRRSSRTIGHGNRVIAWRGKR